jgi:hypothetical protein
MMAAAQALEVRGVGGATVAVGNRMVDVTLHGGPVAARGRNTSSNQHLPLADEPVQFVE